jgi:hypothetical protein
MTNKFFLYGGLTVIIAGGIIAGVIYTRPSENQKGIEQKNVTVTLQTKTTLKNLLSAGGSQKCTFADKNEIAESSGIVYVASGMLRGNFTSITAGKTVQSAMIIRDNTSYVWTDQTSQGFKMSLAEIEAQSAKAGKTDNQQMDINKELSYSCETWAEDANTFSIPTNIQFLDLNDLMKNIPR